MIRMGRPPDQHVQHAAFMAENVISVPAYNSRTGVIAPVKGKDRQQSRFTMDQSRSSGTGPRRRAAMSR